MSIVNLLRIIFLFLVAAAANVSAASNKEVDPAALEDKVSIKVGQKLTVQFTQDGDVLSDPKVVETPADKTPALTLDFRKETDMLMLILRNPFPKTMRLRALARLKGRKDYLETSILPIRAGLSNYESWHDPIEELVLFDFKLSDEKL